MVNHTKGGYDVVLKATALKIDDLLKGRTVFSVPLFQRNYAWDVKEINDFWQDLLDTYEGNLREYFLGSAVFTPHEQAGKEKILDGQQRLATVLLFLSALRDVLKGSPKADNQKRATAINELIYSTDPVDLEKRIKIELNREDKPFFENIVIQGLISNVDYESHRLIKQAYEVFKQNIQQKMEVDEKFAAGILEVILSKFVIIKIEVDNDLRAHLIFETLNDRGLDLSIADLLKNYIFSISGSHLEEIATKWKEMVDNVGDHYVSRFLRHYWCSSKELVRKEDLYKKIRTIVKDTDNARKFAQQLSEESFIYYNLLNPTHEFWDDPECESLLNDLNILRVEQVFIFLLALYKRFYKERKEKFKELLKTTVNFSFRYGTICNLNPNEMERLYSELAIEIRKKEIEIEDIKSKLMRLSPDDTAFIQSFSKKDVRISRLAKYILVNLNDHLLKAQGKKELAASILRINLEHIIPLKPDKDWQNYLKAHNIRLEEWKHRLGNMTILAKEYNRKSANKFFANKKKIYLKSTLPINDELKSYEEFGPKQIEERQQKMAEIALDIWKI
jgi:uncharacterized protein with ParB-like and HNH nuclease domain